VIRTTCTVRHSSLENRCILVMERWLSDSQRRTDCANLLYVTPEIKLHLYMEQNTNGHTKSTKITVAIFDIDGSHFLIVIFFKKSICQSIRT